MTLIPPQRSEPKTVDPGTLFENLPDMEYAVISTLSPGDYILVSRVTDNLKLDRRLMTLSSLQLLFSQPAFSVRGDITSIGNDTTISPNVVTFAKIQNVSAHSILARVSDTEGDLSEVALGVKELIGRGDVGNIGPITIGDGLTMVGRVLSAIPADTISDDEIQFTDITTNNASTLNHGFLKKLSGNSAQFLNGEGNWGNMTEATLSFTDITTNNVSATKHGLFPKLPSITDDKYYCIKNGAVSEISLSAVNGVGGSDTQIQFNNDNTFGGSSGLTWVDSLKELHVKDGSNDIAMLFFGLVRRDVASFPTLTLGSDIGLGFEGPSGETDVGGNLSFIANNGGATSGDGGAVLIGGGSALGGDSNGGWITLQPGLKNGTGSNGKVKIGIGNTHFAILDTGSINTADKTFTFPNTAGTFALISNITDAGLAVTDVTTNDVSATKHGFFPKLPSVADNKYYGLKNGAVVEISSGLGDVVGPSGATANNVALFDGATGKLIKDSGVGISGNNTGDQNNIYSFVVAGQTTITAASSTQAITLVAGTNIGITTDNDTKTITFNSTGGEGGGDLTGPSGATDNAICRFDATTGKIIQDSAATIADTTGDITAGKYNTVAISGSSTPTLAVTGTTSVSGANTGDQTDATLTTSDITTNDVSNTKHGYFPKLPSVIDNKSYGIKNGAVAEITATIGIGSSLVDGVAGSILFVDEGGVFAQETAYLSWYKTDHVLQIGNGTSAVTTAGQAGGIRGYMDGGNAYYVTYCGINTNAGVLASTDIILGNDIATDETNYSDFGISSSANDDEDYSLFANGTAYWYNQDEDIAITTATAGKVVKIGVGGTLTENEIARFTETGLTIGLAGTTLGVLKLSGNTSGTLSVQSPAIASGVNTLQAVTDTFVYKATPDTLTNKRITKRTASAASSATPTINTNNVDMYLLTAQAVNITSFTTNLSGTPTEGQTLIISITGTGARTITWGASFEASSTVALPTETVSTNRLDVGFIWNSVTSKWRCVAAS